MYLAIWFAIGIFGVNCGVNVRVFELTTGAGCVQDGARLVCPWRVGGPNAPDGVLMEALPIDAFGWPMLAVELELRGCCACQSGMPSL